MTQEQYNEAINLIGHLILTASDALRELLGYYGVGFESAPTKRQLIDATIELLTSDTDGFTDALSKLVDRHIDTQVESMIWLRKVGFDLPDAEDAFFGGLIKGAIGAIGGLLKKKKRRNSNNNSGNSGASSSQALQAKRDLELQIQRMQEQQRRRDEERRREQAERLRREQEEKAKRRTQTMLMVGGGVVLLALIGVAVFMSRPKTPMYNPVKQ